VFFFFFFLKGRRFFLALFSSSRLRYLFLKEGFELVAPSPFVAKTGALSMLATKVPKINLLPALFPSRRVSFSFSDMANLPSSRDTRFFFSYDVRRPSPAFFAPKTKNAIFSFSTSRSHSSLVRGIPLLPSPRTIFFPKGGINVTFRQSALPIFPPVRAPRATSPEQGDLSILDFPRGSSLLKEAPVLSPRSLASIPFPPPSLLKSHPPLRRSTSLRRMGLAL